MTTFTCENIGLSESELQDRVVNGLCNQLLSTMKYDDEDSEYRAASRLREKLDKEVARQIEEAVNKIAAKHILPNAENYIETFTIRHTNSFGEKRGEPATFVENLASRAEQYLIEPVDFNGKTKSESGYGWSKKQTRIEHLINRHLQNSIEASIKKMLTDSNQILANAVKQTVNETLKDLAEKIKISVNRK